MKLGMNFKESETVELKTSTSEMKEAMISIVAILNKHQQGVMYFGIGKNGYVAGQQVSDKTLRDVSQSISNAIEPKIYPTITKEIIDGKDCILVEFSGFEVPYYANGRAYIRVGDEDRRLSPQEIKRLIIQKSRDSLRWDNQPSRLGVDDVNEDVMHNFIKKANLAGRIDFDYSDVPTILKKLGLVEDGKLLQAAEVLFCDENPVEVQAAIFAGTDKSTFLDIKQIKGTVFDVLEQSELYLKNNLRWGVEFGKLEREEVPEIPINALREALVNSICHRDYMVPKSNEIAIFKDRLEIYNPGSFPEGLVPMDFIQGRERSVLRNPLIAHVLYLSKEIERWGSGLKRIYDECTANGIHVEFTLLKTGFLVVFERREMVKEGWSEKWSEKWSDLSENQQKILQLIAGNPKISRRELSAKLKMNPSAIQKHMNTLKKKGLLKRVGPAKGGYWDVVK